jgi:hypothetical protein
MKAIQLSKAMRVSLFISDTDCFVAESLVAMAAFMGA